MSDTQLRRCRYSASGHALHPIQFRRARSAGDPVPVTIVGTHATGILVAPLGDPSHIEVWCMHEQWRAVVREAVAEGTTTLLSYKHGLADVGGKFISHTPPECWRECPAPGELQPWQTGFFRIAQDEK